jgi:hypothetical protein
LEAVALAGASDPSADDLALVKDLPGERVIVWSVDASGSVRRRVEL